MTSTPFRDPALLKTKATAVSARRWTGTLICAMGLTLSACGGGGEQGSIAAPPVETDTRNSETAETAASESDTGEEADTGESDKADESESGTDEETIPGLIEIDPEHFANNDLDETARIISATPIEETAAPIPDVDASTLLDEQDLAIAEEAVALGEGWPTASAEAEAILASVQTPHPDLVALVGDYTVNETFAISTMAATPLPCDMGSGNLAGFSSDYDTLGGEWAFRAAVSHPSVGGLAGHMEELDASEVGCINAIGDSQLQDLVEVTINDAFGSQWASTDFESGEIQVVTQVAFGPWIATGVADTPEVSQAAAASVVEVLKSQ